MGKSLLAEVVDQIGPDAVYEQLTREQRAALRYEWRAWARPEQLPPDGDWLVWLMLAGRGAGKTKGGAEWVRAFARDNPGARIALIGRTAADVRTTMLEGPSGLLSISPPDFYPHHEPSKCKLTWPNGSIALTFSAEEPKGLRGPQFNAAWCDELAAWPTYKDEDDEPGVPGAWTQLQAGMRIPSMRPRIVVTTTPRPTKVIRQLIKDPACVVVRWSTYDNAQNLAPEFIDRMRATWEGTRLGRQELHGELLADIEGALWTHSLIDAARVREVFRHDLARIVVALDPAGSAKKTADEVGIVVAGIGSCNCRGKSEPELHGFILADLSGRYSPDDMGRRAVNAYHHWEASRLVAEDNFGGQIVKDLIGLIDSTVSYKAVHASRGKIIRAEPIAAMYEQGKIHHVGGFAKLEDELTTYTPLTPSSPGRLDALVWALTDLMLESPGVVDSDSIAAGQRRTAPSDASEDDDG